MQYIHPTIGGLANFPQESHKTGNFEGTGSNLNLLEHEVHLTVNIFPLSHWMKIIFLDLGFLSKTR